MLARTKPTPMPFRIYSCLFVLLVPSAGLAAAPVPPRSDELLARQFSAAVRPFIDSYCISCHGKDKPEAEFDLTPYSTLPDVVNGFSYWDLVLERLEAGEMPPDDAKKHPNDQQRHEIVAWIQALRQSEATKNAGDPGPVLARRLSNAEYNYSIRDLTGYDINPTRTFPVDPANQAGFDNSGESLSMSPALVKKYLEAARTVAEHLIVKTDGFEFAPHPVVVDTDRDKFAVLRIVDFYKRQPTDLADYFSAAWRFQHRAALGQPRASLAGIAAENKLSAAYLSLVWETLTDGKEDAGPLAKLRAKWRELPAPGGGGDATAVRARAAELRDYVTTLRGKLIPEVPNLSAPQIQGGSQTLVMWKNRQMAANRRTFDRSALHVEGGTSPAETPVATMADARGMAPAPQNQTAPNQTPYATPTANVAAADTGRGPRGGRGPNGRGGRQGGRPQPTDAQRAADQALNATINRGGKFLAPAIVTNASATAMAAARKRGGDPDPELLVPADPTERARHEAAFARFASVFPDAFYISERARVNRDAAEEQKLAGRLLSAGLHSMTGFFRDDGPLYDLVLDDAGRRELDKLWRDFDYAASIPQRMHTSFVWFERTDSRFMNDEQFDPYRPEDRTVTTQEKIRKLAEIYLEKAVANNASETVQQAIREHFAIVAENNLRMDQLRAAAEPTHVQALLAWAERAYRRPLTSAEREALRTFYRTAREQNGVEHEDALRDCVVAVLMSPHFCYRIDLVEAAGDIRPAGGAANAARAGAAQVSTHTARGAGTAAAKPAAVPISSFALASRLSYFLWASIPDAELLALAGTNELQKPGVLAAQARRMLRDPRARNFATEFAGHWLDFRRFEEHNAVDRERFPSFDSDLRQAMFEEPLRFMTDLLQQDRSVLNLLYGDYTFVNAPLAKHYGMPAPASSTEEWVRVDGAAKFERGGLLPMAVFLTANSPGLRTSPVKRGYWVVRRVLGERIPPPPPTVPELPNDETKLGELTLRETLAKHRENKACAACHARFDSFGLVFEGFGAIGERREKDFGGRAVDARAEFPGGKAGTGVTGLREHIRAEREKDFVDNFSRKLVAYALGRTLLMSDDPLIAEMKAKLTANEHRVGPLIETIVTSLQFRMKRSPAAAGASQPAKLAQASSSR